MVRNKEGIWNPKTTKTAVVPFAFLKNDWWIDGGSSELGASKSVLVVPISARNMCASAPFHAAV